MKQQIRTPCGKPIRYACKTPHKFLEKFSKNLYGTTGGTYSSRFLRPVMQRSHCGPNEFREIKVCGGPDLRAFPLQVRLHSTHLPDIRAQQDLPPNWWKWSKNVCDNMHAARGGKLVESRELAFWGHQHAHNPGWLRSLQRCERAHRPAGESWFFCSTYRHQRLGADPEDNQHHTFLPGERGGYRSILHSLGQNHQGNLWWLRRRTLPRWVQRSDFKAERAKVLLSCVLASPPLRG